MGEIRFIDCSVRKNPGKSANGKMNGIIKNLNMTCLATENKKFFKKTLKNLKTKLIFLVVSQV
jgi:hypothetical protein